MRDAATAPPEALRTAVDRALQGDWQAAHVIVQGYEEDRTAAWIHAIVHRMEGDASNAQYWYRRCGHDPGEDVSTADELREVAAVLAEK
jgi:hypothetical protein